MSTGAVLPPPLARLRNLKSVRIDEAHSLVIQAHLLGNNRDALYEWTLNATILNTTAGEEIGKIELALFFPFYDSHDKTWDCYSILDDLNSVLNGISEELAFLARFIIRRFDDDVIQGPFAYLLDFQLAEKARGKKLGVRALKALYTELYKIADLYHIFLLPGAYRRKLGERELRGYFEANFDSRLVEQKEELVEIMVWRELRTLRTN